MGSAGVNLKEVDLTLKPKNFPGVSGGIVIQSNKGKINQRVLCTSPDDYVSKFGEPDPKLGLSHYSALAFLTQSDKLWVVRVANNYKFSASVVQSVDGADYSKVSTGILALDSYVFEDDDVDSMLITCPYPSDETNGLSYQILPSDNYKDAFVIKVFEDVKGGVKLVGTYEVSRIKQKQNGKQLYIEDVINGKSPYIHVIDNPSNIDSGAKPEKLKALEAIDYQLYKEPYTLATGETLKNATSKATPKGSIVYDNGVYWEYIGSADKTEGYTINPSTFTAVATKDEWRAVTDLVMPRTYLSGGTSGDPVTIGDMMKGADLFSNPEEVDITLFLDGGITNHAYHTYMNVIAKNRINTFAIMSVDPEAELTVDTYVNEIVNYRKESLINSSFAAMYSPHVKIYDKYNDMEVYASPDGYAGGVIAFTARNSEIWVPPAGWENGILDVNGLNVVFDKGERDILYDNGINPLRKHPTKGISLWGQKTLLALPSALDRINVRLLMIVIEPSVMDFLDNYEFKLNNDINRLLVKTGIEGKMKSIKSRGGVYEYYVVCDESNNPGEVIDNNEMYADVYVKPTKSAEFITYRSILTPTSVSFDAILLS